MLNKDLHYSPQHKLFFGPLLDVNISLEVQLCALGCPRKILNFACHPEQNLLLLALRTGREWSRILAVAFVRDEQGIRAL
jgi:hypothetical protein